MTEIGPLLAIPMGFLFQAIWKFLEARIFLALTLIVLTLQQLSFTWKYDQNFLWSEDCTKTFYWQTLFKTKIDYDDLVVYDTDEQQPHDISLRREIYFTDFDDSLNTRYVRNTCGDGNFSLLADNRALYYNLIEGRLDRFHVQPKDWIKVNFDACNLPPAATLYNYVGMNLAFFRNSDITKVLHIRIQNKYPPDKKFGIWSFATPSSGHVSFFSQVPENALPSDRLLVFIGNPSSTRVSIDNFSVEVWR